MGKKRREGKGKKKKKRPSGIGNDKGDLIDKPQQPLWSRWSKQGNPQISNWHPPCQLRQVSVATEKRTQLQKRSTC
jgi:hypothetical protein